MAGGRLSETFAPRLGRDLLLLVPGVAIAASFVASVLLFFGLSLMNGGRGAFGDALFLSLIAGAVALFAVLGGLALLAVPLTFAARALKVTWRVAGGVAGVISLAASGAVGLALKSSDIALPSAVYAVITASFWLFALYHFARDIQPADIDGVVVGAP